MIYYIMPVIIYFLIFLTSKPLESQKLISIFMMVFMIILGGLRWETGTDWEPYYNDYLNPGARVDFEVGYIWLTSILSIIGLNYTNFLLVSYTITIILVHLGFSAYLKWNPLPLLFFYSYYYIGSFLGAQRRIFAIALCVLSISFIKKSKPIIFYGIVIFASLFHSSVLIFLPAYLIYHLSQKKYYALLASIGIMAICITIFGFEILLARVLNIFDIGIVAHKLTTYATEASDYELTGASIIGIGALKRILLLSLFVYCLRFNKHEPNYSRLLRLYTISLFLYFGFSYTFSMFSVLSIYYGFVEVLLLTYCLQGTIKKHALMALAVAIFIVMQISSIIYPYRELYFPYISIFENTTRAKLY